MTPKKTKARRHRWDYIGLGVERCEWCKTSRKGAIFTGPVLYWGRDFKDIPTKNRKVPPCQ